MIPPKVYLHYLHFFLLLLYYFASVVMYFNVQNCAVSVLAFYTKDGVNLAFWLV